MTESSESRRPVMELVKVGGPASVQCTLTGSNGQGQVWRTLKVRKACLHTGRAYVSLGLSHMPMMKDSLVGGWGDAQLMVLLELLPRWLSHCTPNLSQ
jgi:hypothetical protein